ncbi:MAG TPA: MBL fold metallo-hydrolase [Pyrinomonadaceae bacterium]|nr:MBL fold metallo-hydrolase [Pyrinomonadaceae bacterium]
MSEKKSLQNKIEPVAAGVSHLKIVFVNAFFIDTPENTSGSWVLIDTGLPYSGGGIKRFAEKIYGVKGSRPSAIVLTHGHFDHAGAVLNLATNWNVPVYAHRLEMPYLTGKSDYPPQDPTVGGALAQMSRLFPHGGIDLGNLVRQIAENGEIEEMRGWRVVHTPGHTAGHISLFRESDKTLLAGDALATMNQDSWISNITEEREFSHPPAPFTTDWIAARHSVETLAELEPSVVAAGHGQSITGGKTAEKLKFFAANFTAPARGRYVNQPAIADESGILRLPPTVADPVRQALIGAAVLAGGALVFGLLKRRRDNISETNFQR